MSFGFRHLLLAIIVHAAVFILMGAGVQCTRKPEKPTVIQAVLLDPSRQKVAEQKRRTETERRRREEEEKRKAEDEAQKKKEQEQQELQRRQEEEREKAELVARQKAEAKQKAELELRKKEQERKQKEQDEARRKEIDNKKQEEARKKQEQERIKAEEAHRRELMQEELQARMASELAAEEAARADAQRGKALALWQAAVADKIRRNWLRPAGTAEEFECVVEVRQVAGGHIVGRRILRSCGNAVLDESVLRAIDKSTPLPALPPELGTQPYINITFTPTA